VLYYVFCNGVSCINVPEVSIDFNDEDEEICEINQFFTSKTRDDEDETKEEEENSQDELIDPD